MDENTIRLVKAARRGKMSAFEPLFLQEKEYLYRTAFLYMKNESDAMDLVQECILQCMLSIGKLKNPEYFRTWIGAGGRYIWRFVCDNDTLQVLPVNTFAENGCGIVDVRATDYEIQVSVITDTETVWVVAFDQNGNLLEYAGDKLNTFNENYEIWRFAGNEDLQALHIYVVEEAKWLDEWKGQLYDGVLTGSEMMELLEEQGAIFAEVQVQ